MDVRRMRRDGFRTATCRCVSESPDRNSLHASVRAMSHRTQWWALSTAIVVQGAGCGRVERTLPDAGGTGAAIDVGLPHFRGHLPSLFRHDERGIHESDEVVQAAQAPQIHA
jgi:hypothetical protein